MLSKCPVVQGRFCGRTDMCYNRVMQQWSDWIFLLLGSLLAGVGLGMLGWSLFWDRSCGRRRCPKCWYEMRGTKGLRCSECGYKAKREKRLFSTRRRWRAALLAFLLLLTAYGVLVTPRVRRSWIGWPGVIPTSILVAGVPFVDPDGSLLYELQIRVVRNELWDWQKRWLTHRCLAILKNDSERYSRTLVAIDTISFLGPGGQQALPALLQTIQDDDAVLRKAATTAIGVVGVDDRSVLQVLIELLEDPNEEVRTVAIVAIESHGSSKSSSAALSALTRCLSDESEVVRIYSAIAIGKIGADSQLALSVVVEAVKSPNRSLRIGALLALAELEPDTEGVITAIASALFDGDGSVRLTATQILASLGTDAAAAVPALIQTLDDDRMDVQQWAVYALGQIGPNAEAAIPYLEAMLESQDVDLQDIAKVALDSIRRRE